MQQAALVFLSRFLNSFASACPQSMHAAWRVLVGFKFRCSLPFNDRNTWRTGATLPVVALALLGKLCTYKSYGHD